MALKALFYPDVPFDTLFIPFIYKEIYFDGVYVDVLNGRKDMVIMDVGANIGVVTHHMLPHAKKIYAIEPSPEHFEALAKNKSFNGWENVELFNIAIADKDGEMTLTQNENNRTMNTIVMGNPVGNNEFEYTGRASGKEQKTIKADKNYKNQVLVQTMGFDTFMEKNKIDTVDFCKFDVEGAEDLILRSAGFRKVAERVKAIEVEFHFPTWPQLADYMISLGYQARRYPCDAVVILFSR